MQNENGKGVATAHEKSTSPSEVQKGGGRVRDVRGLPSQVYISSPTIIDTEKIVELFDRRNYNDMQIYVSVWNCKAKLCVVKGDKVITEDDMNLSEEQKKKLKELKEKVIYEDNCGAINWSGFYYPSIETLEEIVEVIGECLKHA